MLKSAVFTLSLGNMEPACPDAAVAAPPLNKASIGQLIPTHTVSALAPFAVLQN